MSDKSPTLEQLRTFIAVVENKSFSRAAQALGRAQSVVSYTIANLEAQFGFAVFERGRRQPTLTEAGRSILADARRVDLMMRQLDARAAGLIGGLEGEVGFAVDVLYPSTPLVPILQMFATTFPTTSLNLQIEALGGVLSSVLDGDCNLGIAGPQETWPDLIDATAAGSVQMEAVAAPRHPLARHEGTIPIAALRDHTQLVLSDRSRLTEGRNFSVYAAHTWRLGDLGAKHRLLLAGLGWGFMPAHIVEQDIVSGALVHLSLADHGGLIYPFSVIRRVDSALGPATQWLIERFALQRSDPSH